MFGGNAVKSGREENLCFFGSSLFEFNEIRTQDVHLITKLSLTSFDCLFSEIHFLVVVKSKIVRRLKCGHFFRYLIFHKIATLFSQHLISHFCCLKSVIECSYCKLNKTSKTHLKKFVY